MAKRAAILALQMLLVIIGVRLGAEMAQSVRIIPKALLKLPEISFSAADMRTVITSVFIATLIAALGNRLINGWDVFANARRFAKELYALLVGIVAASLYLFLLSSVNFSPEFLLQATLSSVVILLITFAIVQQARGQNKAPQAFGAGFANIFILLKSPWAWLVVLFALSPLIIAMKFTTDRDFAAWVTNLRVSANVESDLPYTLVSAIGDTRFETPIMAQFADSDPNTVYVLERNGSLYSADYPAGTNKTLLVDLRADVGDVEMENGALGFDLHPRFGADDDGNAFVYIYFTEYRADGQTNRLERFDLSGADEAARRATRTPLIAQERNNDGYHNGGSVEFGPDGMLYLAVGENSETACHQKIDCGFMGGVFRIDVDMQGGDISKPIETQPKKGQTANYFIPLDNPFVGRAGAMEEYWALGLRNPFRIAFDTYTGELWAGEVGSTVWEEVNKIEKGGNYQFPFIEGFEEQERYTRPETIAGEEREPVYTYQHTAFLRSVIGGTPYRGSVVPQADGHYVFMDNYSGEIFILPLDAERVETVTAIARTSDVAQRGPTSVIQAPDGNILITVMGDNDQPTGQLLRLVPADSDEGQAAAEQALIAAAEKKAAPVTALTAEQTASLWGVNCARCHGAEGRGDGPDSEELGAYVPDFGDPNYHKWRSDEALKAVLVGGGLAVGQSPMMPPWEGVLSDQEMDALVQHVRGFESKE
ncbi:PQQ-dependent sugar dehydrogenase [Pacificimonas sp. WHA3]|uniref:PQQ-dependent sugar dehydrogenase n=1 Tax=Pacificimonas pallii TaxID=2827236 RepID=A0ABS6SDF0_9SPHN|nr:PQQ-dependent sugar dehydrogenase [Pacificimonas pallii]MBV7256448.1 PQQ-dependent sugar dehydrogenase [Pacificimonas pallii]